MTATTTKPTPPVAPVDDLSTAMQMLKRFQKQLAENLPSNDLRRWVLECATAGLPVETTED